MEYAWILNEKNAGPHPARRLYWTGFPKDQWAPSSALIKLVQAIFDRYQDQSFFLLRQKIKMTAPLTDLDRAVLQLVAKRAERVEVFNFSENADLSLEEVAPPSEILFRSRLSQVVVPTGPAFLKNDDAILSRLQFLRDLVPRGEILHDFNRPVAAVLCDPEGKVLWESVHGGFLNKTLHAETRLVQDYFHTHQSRFPEGSRLYVTLKPCRMCSAMLAKMSEGLRDFKTVYLEEDPGRLAQGTLLEKQGRLFKWSDPAREPV